MRVRAKKELHNLLLLTSILMARDATAFLANISVTTGTFASLQENPGDPDIHHRILVPALTELKEKVSHAILVDPGSAFVETESTTAEVELDDDDCDIHITAIGVHATGTDAKLWQPEEAAGMADFRQKGPHISFPPATLEYQLKITGSIKISQFAFYRAFHPDFRKLLAVQPTRCRSCLQRLGGTIVFRCVRASTDPIPLLLKISAAMQVASSLDLSNARLEQAGGKPWLVFDLHHSFEGKLEKWKLDRIKIQGKGCKFMLVGEWNTCDRVEDLMKRGDRIDHLMLSLKPLRPKLANLVEEQLKAAVGSKVEVLLRVEGQDIDHHAVPHVIYA